MFFVYTVLLDMQLAFLHPKYWLTWLGLGFLWLLAQMPWKLQMGVGGLFGRLMFRLLKRRRFICLFNLEMAFPELSSSKREKLALQHFMSMGKGIVEMAMGWWCSKARLKQLSHFEGLEHLQKEHHANEKTADKKTGIILLSAHFTSFELSPSVLAASNPLHAVYRTHQNPLIDWLIARARAKRYGKVLPSNNIREMIKSLKGGNLVWYAQDQNYGLKNSVFVPFFGIEAATNTGISRISKMSGAKVIPYFALRLPDKGYLLRFLPALDNFPSDDPKEDALRINKIIEDQVREFPEQYLWTHQRYKDDPEGGNRYEKERAIRKREGRS